FHRDKIGRVRSAKDLVHKVSSKYVYDGFGCLGHFTLAGGTANLSSTFDYDDTGDLEQRINGGSPSLHLTYGGAGGPPAVTACGLGNYSYNERGEQVARPGMIVPPGLGGLPTQIVRTDGSNDTLTMDYDATLTRTITKDTTTNTRRISLDRQFE